MDRRQALHFATVASMAAAAGVLNGAQNKTATKEEVKMEGGWQYKDLVYEKHIPEVNVAWEEDVAAIEVHVKHPQIAEHHISTFKIYNQDRIEISRFDLHPELSQPKATFYLHIPKGTHLIATTDCNIHGIWMKKFEV